LSKVFSLPPHGSLRLVGDFIHGWHLLFVSLFVGQKEVQEMEKIKISSGFPFILL
jgi:hypothetical protein